MPKQRLSNAQKRMIDALRTTAGNISEAAKASNTGRSTHYKWLGNNEKYALAISEIDESLLDLTESKLLLNINKGDQKAIQYYLDSKGKKRGYGQNKKLELTGKDEGPIEHTAVTHQAILDAEKALDERLK